MGRGARREQVDGLDVRSLSSIRQGLGQAERGSTDPASCVQHYLAHLAKASSHRLLAALLDEHPWLTAYFDIADCKAKRTWKPLSGFSRLADQHGWFRRGWPASVIFFQVGSYFELYGRDAVWASQTLGLKPQEPRFRRIPRVGVPARLVDQYADSVLAAGKTVLKVTETGYPLYRLKERLPAVLRMAP